ncbi:extracellular solute-binding protein [Isoptericola sp. NPDC057391]|uniref:extracellular solute-binding protein n=1 Tax=Isoptericola sp. NPDC057391 TaxID=3346117 RepID=UPI00362B7C99
MSTHTLTSRSRRRGRTLTSGVAGVVVASLALSACGIGGGSGEVAANGKPTMAGRCELSDEVTSDERLSGEPSGEITFQTTALKQDFSPYFEKLIAAFEEKYPEVTVKWQDDPGDAEFTQRLVTNAQSCDLPDVVNLNQTTAYALYRENFLLDLTTKGPEDIGEPFIPSVWESQKFPGDDDHYVLPWYWGLNGLQTFNKDLMKDAGLDPEAPPSTVMEQLDMASQIAEKSGGEYYAFPANPYTHVPNDWQLMNAEITNADETEFTFADDPKIQEWLTKYAELYAEGALPKDTLSSDVDVTQLYSAGDVVWGSTNASFLRYVKDTNEATYDVTGVGTLFDARGHAFQDGQLIGVPSTSKNPVAAVAFAQFLLSPEWQTEFVSSPLVSNFPSTEESLDIPKFTDITGDSPLDEANRLSVEAATDAENAFIFAWSDAVQTAVVSELQLAISGKKPADEALQAAEDAANRILEQQG